MVEFLSSLWNLSDRVVAQLTYLSGDAIPFAVWETLYSTFFATLFAYVIGLPLGVLLVTGEENGIRPLPRWLMGLLNIVVNLLRSVPFTILMVVCFPIARLVIGTSIGTNACIVSLTIAAAPFVARVVESSLRELDRGVLEAAQAMGCSTWQIVTKVMLPESKPSLLNGLTTATITILSYGAMAGSIGGGGLGAMALLHGHGRQESIVLYVSVICLVILVQIIQSIGTALCIKTDKRIHKQSKRRTNK